jgi:hypothetical protein
VVSKDRANRGETRQFSGDHRTCGISSARIHIPLRKRCDGPQDWRPDSERADQQQRLVVGLASDVGALEPRVGLIGERCRVTRGQLGGEGVDPELGAAPIPNLEQPIGEQANTSPGSIRVRWIGLSPR